MRATLLSIVLTLAVGQTAGLACMASCSDATPAGCSHQDSTSCLAISADGCRGCVAVSSVVFVREEAQLTGVAPDEPYAIVAQLRVGAPPIRLRSGFEARRRLPCGKQPRVIALRI